MPYTVTADGAFCGAFLKVLSAKVEGENLMSLRSSIAMNLEINYENFIFDKQLCYSYLLQSANQTANCTWSM